MLVPVYEPPVQVDSTNIGAFRSRVDEMIARYGAIVVDCSQVTSLGPSGMRVLRIATREAMVTLVNPNPSLQLMAAAYGFDTDHTDTSPVMRMRQALTPSATSREDREPRAAESVRNHDGEYDGDARDCSEYEDGGLDHVRLVVQRDDGAYEPTVSP